MKTVWISLRQYVRLTGKFAWVILMDFLLAIGGAVLDVSGAGQYPMWLWILLFAVAAVIAPFLAFHRQRLEMDQLRIKCGIKPLEDEKTFFDHPKFGLVAGIISAAIGTAFLLALGAWFGREHLRRDVIHEFDTKIEMEIIGPDGKKIGPRPDEKSPE